MNQLEATVALPNAVKAVDLVGFFARHRECWDIRLLTSCAHEPTTPHCWDNLERLWMQSMTPYTVNALEMRCAGGTQGCGNQPRCWCSVCHVKSVSGRIRVMLGREICIDVDLTSSIQRCPEDSETETGERKKLLVEMRPHSATLIPYSGHKRKSLVVDDNNGEKNKIKNSLKSFDHFPDDTLGASQRISDEGFANLTSIPSQSRSFKSVDEYRVTRDKTGETNSFATTPSMATPVVAWSDSDSGKTASFDTDEDSNLESIEDDTSTCELSPDMPVPSVTVGRLSKLDTRQDEALPSKSAVSTHEVCSHFYHYNPKGPGCDPPSPDVNSFAFSEQEIRLRLLHEDPEILSTHARALDLELALLQIADLKRTKNKPRVLTCGDADVRQLNHYGSTCDKPINDSKQLYLDHLQSALLCLWGHPEIAFAEEVGRCTLATLHLNKCLHNELPRALITELPSSFRQWMDEESIVVPECITAEPKTLSTLDLDAASSMTQWSRKLTQYIENCSYQVWPKLDWCSPRDSAWVMGGRSSCCSVEEVMVLLKSSTLVADVLEQPFKYTLEGRLGLLNPSPDVPLHLCLQQWNDTTEALEFRVFFWGSSICGISQRNLTKCFPSLTKDPEFLEALKLTITNFFQTKLYTQLACTLANNAISPDFEEKCCRGSIDVYFIELNHIDESTSGLLVSNGATKCKNVKLRLKCHLWDVSPWGSYTDPLLFSWSELRDRALADPTSTDSIDFRIIKSNMQARLFKPEEVHAFPEDLWDDSRALRI